jgi:hypothetical protein
LPHSLFTFRPGPVTALAEGFTASADRLDGWVGEFDAQAENVTGGFGATSEATEARSPHGEMPRDMATVLREISAELRDHAAGLHHAVASYQGAENARAQRFWGK